MKYLTLEPLFTTILSLAKGAKISLFVISLILVIAFVAYRFNHRIQAKASLLMDNECRIYNEKGLEKFLKINGKKFSNPTIVVVYIKNLEYLYVNYQNHDSLMYQISNILLDGLNDIEVVARIEFDKFIIIYDNKSREKIKEQCSSIEEKIDNLVLDGYGKYNFYICYGIYESAPLSEGSKVIYKAASIIDCSTVKDQNLYYYSKEVDDYITSLAKMNQEKDADLEQKRFIPYIQPKVDFKTGKVLGGEILVRWIDESNNIKYSPKDFIPLFESNGFIKKIDEAMLRAACSLVQTLNQRGKKDIVISVNLSKLLFMSTNFEKRLMDIVSEYQISPSSIEFEITETTVMENYQHVSNCIMELRQMGFLVAMDDFGKEYSSLGSLSQTPFDTIKLDMVFFKDRLSTEKSKNIVSNLLNMLKKINYHIVCEGIEDKQTLDVLATINRDVVIQGYVFSRPIPLPQFEAFLDTTFEFDYPEIEEETTTKRVSNNVGSKQSSTYSEIDDMRQQMLKMQLDFQKALDEQKQQAYQNEMNNLRSQVEAMRNMAQQPQRDYRDDAIDSLKREIEMLKKGNVPENNVDPHDREIDELKKQINELKNQPKQIDVDDLVAKITKAQQDNSNEELRMQLEKERKEKLELEKILQQMEDEAEDMSDEEIEKEQEIANKKLNLDIDSLSDDDSDSLEDEEEDEEASNIEKPQYSLEELEGIIQKYMEKYNSQWNQKAKEELKDGYYEIINGLQYYRGKVYFNLSDRIKRASDEVKQLYNIAKNELLQYNGVINKTLSSYDAFYIGQKQIAKLAITKRSVRVYLALDPSQYSERQFPHKDVSSKKAHARTPYYMMIRSKLSVKRMKMLIEDMMLSEKTKLNEEYSPVDYAAKFKFTRKK